MEETIAAIATAYGEGGIGIIRISGENALDILNQVFVPFKENKIKERKLTYGHIRDKEEIIDEVMAVYMKAPHTYTREDVVEINCHGSIVSLRKTLALVLAKGARIAEPGEFTKRAFLNGRLDLSQAEAVIDLIRARTDKSFDVALKQLDGSFSDEIKSIRKNLVDILVNVTVNIDYPDEDIEQLTYSKLKDDLMAVKASLEKIISTADRGKIIKEGLNVAIIGRPNVGKSSLMNALLKETRAIVTEIPGTTRDTIQEQMSIRGIPVLLTDTAGIRETNNVVEKLGVEKSKDIINKSDLIIALFDISRPFTLEDEAILSSIKSKKSIIILNKTDLPTKIDLNKFTSYNVIKTSVKEDIGKEELLNMIKELFSLNEIETGDFTYLSNARQISLIKEALKLCLEIKYQNEQNTPVDLIQIDLQNLWEKLGEITGDAYKDELLDEIFSKFCLGK